MKSILYALLLSAFYIPLYLLVYQRQIRILRECSKILPIRES
ncbi:hypothetical protein ABLB84_07810 [Xenorhabdus szentirmaii]